METETEASWFETSEMVSTFLASTPLLSHSWMLCSHANTSAPHSFLTDTLDGVAYLAFSGIQTVAASTSASDPSLRSLLPLDCAPFTLLQHRRHPHPPMVDSGFFHLFLSLYNSPSFQRQVFEIRKKSKAVVFTGHSIGATLASLSALWLLCNMHSISPIPVLCITFGSPLLGNKSLSQVILQERWSGNFCHVVARHDIVPRLLLAPLPPLTPQLHSLLQFWHLSINSAYSTQLPLQLTHSDTSNLFHFVLACVEESAKAEEGSPKTAFWPLGNYMFCSDEGAICVDNAVAAVKMLHLTFAMASASSCIEDHLRYKDYVGKVSLQFLKRRGFEEEDIPKSSYEAGVELALQSSGKSTNESLSRQAGDCLKNAKWMGQKPNLRSANLATELSKITPLRAQIEWYKALCDESDSHMGYYDTFKQRGASKRDSKVNLNRIKLAQFWNELIRMLEANELPYDFLKRAKWVNASQFYKLLVEPLDIAEYYRSGVHRTRGHYVKHGRERRYEIFDRWWKERDVGEEENNKRSKFASLTQDSCFWARVEEAREWVDNVRTETDVRKLPLLWENIDNFEQYAKGMVERKEVSIDVMAKNSSYSLWVEEWRELKSQLPQFHTQFPAFMNEEMVP